VAVTQLSTVRDAGAPIGNDTGVLLEHLFRHQVGRVVGHLARVLGPARLDLAEESMQEAMLHALQIWPYQGIPESPGAWLFRVAHNAAIDSLRRGRFLEQNSNAVVAELTRASSIESGDLSFEEQLRDDELRMIFMCCHPEIARDARVALSLKTVGGFSVREIAAAFLADDAAIAQRLVRAKRQLRERHVTLDLPCAADLDERLDSALETVYFIFNEGYAAHEGGPDSARPVFRSSAPGAFARGFFSCDSPRACPGSRDGAPGRAPSRTHR
jgi:RNA polymerase sigma-70 factor, ECF subfamily